MSSGVLNISVYLPICSSVRSVVPPWSVIGYDEDGAGVDAVADSSVAFETDQLGFFVSDNEGVIVKGIGRSIYPFTACCNEYKPSGMVIS